MGQAYPFKCVGLVVEDDVWQRELVAALLEESEMNVIQCESAEAALRALRALSKVSGGVSLMITDVNLAGRIDGVELAHLALEFYPDMHIVVTSGLALARSLPEGAMFMPKPLLPQNVLREAQRSQH
jgi:DNA-binding NtrC family response regulator